MSLKGSLCHTFVTRSTSVQRSSLCLWEIYPFKSIIDTTAILRRVAARLMSRNVPIKHGQLCGNIPRSDIISPQRLARDDTKGTKGWLSQVRLYVDTLNTHTATGCPRKISIFKCKGLEQQGDVRQGDFDLFFYDIWNIQCFIPNLPGHPVRTSII